MIGPGRISVQLSGGLSSRKDDGVGTGGDKKGKSGLDKKDKETRGEKRTANGRSLFLDDMRSQLWLIRVEYCIVQSFLLLS